MIVLQGSTHVLSIANLKDATGKSEPLPAGMLPTYSVSPPNDVTFGAQDQKDGSQPVTFDNTFTGDMTFSASLVYPDGDVVNLTPVTVTVAAPEDVTGDVVLT